MKNNQTRKLTFTAILTAMNVVLSQFISIPLGPIKAFPMQHFINVLCAVIVGPWYGLAQAFLTSVIRLLMGTATPFAFPGSMIGVLLAGFLYKRYKSIGVAALGEVIGTGLIGSLMTIPLIYAMNLDISKFYVIVPLFIVSTLIGSLIAYVLLIALKKRNLLK
ncbi:energy coupling factor transporter S component ThiW [Macrococcus hajekii]|uniref:Energy coupling factor transporter S component ThiW n=1 Tax=Macrococcus hajekii TaxID=198482 RepID=A0A4R6BN47_9STAP|nr:energy coupling factor transporter S component ThiW [Macrococcus hajekii]TDM03122.1 energy coupling factor transporter S component ThiW [Macrococcus hajekii]GGA96150.1 energy coupling factor transporter S component ThiW [Macrococcus hajekii]